jgi:hypothetical protein
MSTLEITQYVTNTLEITKTATILEITPFVFNVPSAYPGTLDDTVALDGAPVDVENALSQIVAKIKELTSSTNWWDTTGAAVLKSLFDANTVLAANADNTPVAVLLAELQILGRLTGGNIKGLSVAELQTLIGLSNYVANSLYDANTILAANTDNTPAAVTIAEQQVPLRLTGGNIKGGTVAELITLALSAALPENVEIQLVAGTLSADGKYSGITVAGTAGATLAFGDLVYLQTADSRWELASADNAATGHNFKLGICILAAANDGSATKILLMGKVRADTAFPALTVGAPVYMGTTAGDVQTTAPSGATDIIRCVGYGIGADTLYFDPDTTTLEHV